MLKQYKRRKLLLYIGIPLFSLVLMILGIIAYYDSQMIVSLIPSPTGEYTVEMRFTCAFSYAYHGKFYLWADNKKYYLNNYAPGECKWISDNEFTIGGPGSVTGMYKYNVDDIITNGNVDSVVIIYQPRDFSKVN